MADAVKLLRRAFEGGILFFDTARGYSDSEAKIGAALGAVRREVVIATKTHATTKAAVLQELATSLQELRTDYIDIYQLHNPQVLADPADPNGTYAALCEAKQKGYIRFIGISSHQFKLARQALESKAYDTLQFPLSFLSAAEDCELIALARKREVGFIAMKALAGGLITNAAAAFAFMRTYPNVVPIWGIETEAQLTEFLFLEQNPPALDEALQALIARDRAQLCGSFCRGCGYCLPCPAGIPIPMAARIALLARRMPYQRFLEAGFYEQMLRIQGCTGCGHCREHCPYQLDTPRLLKEMLTWYLPFYATHTQQKDGADENCNRNR
jgi:predicted aldo/keto reductase-like oxidoreductase